MNTTNAKPARTAHTPGPWTVLEGMPDGGGIAIGPILESIGGPHAIVTFNGGESEANARLIAQAPALLAALHRALAMRTLPKGAWTKEETVRSWSAWEADAIQLIARAEGR